MALSLPTSRSRFPQLRPTTVAKREPAVKAAKEGPAARAVQELATQGAAAKAATWHLPSKRVGPAELRAHRAMAALGADRVFEHSRSGNSVFFATKSSIFKYRLWRVRCSA